MSFFSTFRERLVRWLTQTNQTRREIILASLFLLMLVITGTVGYTMLEGWSWLDGLYMTFITLTTIGFTEVHPLGGSGRIFTIIIAIVGIGSVAFVGARAAQLLLATQRLQERHIKRKINRMEQHYIICGFGRVGQRIAQDLKRAGKSFVVIERDEEEIEALREQGIPYVEGDAEDEEVLSEAGIERARGVIIALPEDSSNVFVTLVAKELNPNLFILARTNHHKNRRKMLHAGANKVIAPDEVGADRMAQVILRPNVDRFMEQVLHTGALGLQVEEVVVQPDAPLAGKSLAESNFRQQFDAIVIAIIDARTDEMKFNPSPHDVIQSKDVLIVLGNPNMIGRLRDEGCTA